MSWIVAAMATRLVTATAMAAQVAQLGQVSSPTRFAIMIQRVVCFIVPLKLATEG